MQLWHNLWHPTHQHIPNRFFAMMPQQGMLEVKESQSNKTQLKLEVCIGLLHVPLENWMELMELIRRREGLLQLKLPRMAENI